jgi:hypothetical protein
LALILYLLYHHQILVYLLLVHLQEQEVDLVVAVLVVEEVEVVDSVPETS